MSMTVGSLNSNEIDMSANGAAAHSQLVQMLQQLDDLISRLLSRLPNDDKNTPPVGSGGSPGSGSSPLGAPGANGAPPPAAANDAPPSGAPASPNASAPSSASGLTQNAGGVAQAKASEGVSPDSVKVINTGTGNDKTFNVTNNTNRPESFTYSIQGENKGTLTLQPGQTGSFVSSSADIGVRISPSDANGNTRPNEVLYEDGGADNGQDAGAGNPDISKVDGNKDFDGHEMNMTVTMSNGRTAGDGDAIRAYMYSTDDAAAMGLAGDKSKTANIVMSDA